MVNSLQFCLLEEPHRYSLDVKHHKHYSLHVYNTDQESNNIVQSRTSSNVVIDASCIHMIWCKFGWYQDISNQEFQSRTRSNAAIIYEAEVSGTAPRCYSLLSASHLVPIHLQCIALTKLRHHPLLHLRNIDPHHRPILKLMRAFHPNISLPETYKQSQDAVVYCMSLLWNIDYNVRIV